MADCAWDLTSSARSNPSQRLPGKAPPSFARLQPSPCSPSACRQASTAAQRALDRASHGATMAQGEKGNPYPLGCELTKKEVGMYKTILVPLDGSERAEAILPHVEELAHRFEARVLLLQVAEPLPVAADVAGVTPLVDLQITEQLKKNAKSYLARLRRRFHKKGIAAEARVAFGPAVSTILDLAKRDCVDLIAMASHGRSGLERVFYGSVAAGVLHGVECSLLLVRSRTDE